MRRRIVRFSKTHFHVSPASLRIGGPLLILRHAVSGSLEIESLTLLGYLYVPTLAEFVAQCQQLRIIHLETRAVDSPRDLHPMLDVLAPSLISLTIYSESELAPLEIDHLRRLETIDLNPHFCTTELVDNLVQQPNLKFVDFTGCTEGSPTPAYSHLHTLLHPRTKPPFLKRIICATPAGIDGDDEDFDGLADWGTIDESSDVTLEWTDDWTLERAQTLVAFAKEGKVDIGNLRLAVAIAEARLRRLAVSAGGAGGSIEGSKAGEQ